MEDSIIAKASNISAVDVNAINRSWNTMLQRTKYNNIKTHSLGGASRSGRRWSSKRIKKDSTIEKNNKRPNAEEGKEEGGEGSRGGREERREVYVKTKQRRTGLDRSDESSSASGCGGRSAVIGQ